MNLPAISYNGAVPILDVETMLARLPARVRAEVAWVEKPIQEGLERLRGEPLDARLLDDVSQALTEPLLRVGLAFWRTLAESPDEWRAVVMQELRREHQRLAEFLQDPEAEDTLEWVLGYVRSFFSMALIKPSQEVLSDAPVQETAEYAPFRPFTRGQIALMAAMSTVGAEGSPRRAHDLLDLAFLNLVAFRDALRREGIHLSPFPDETTQERRERLLASSRSLRSNLTDEDWQALTGARFHNLR